MSRYTIRDNCTIDIIAANAGFINHPLSIYFPGESLFQLQLNTSLPPQMSTEILSVHKVDVHKTQIIITGLPQANDKDFLSSSLISSLNASLTPIPSEILIGVFYYSDLSILMTPFINLIEILINPLFTQKQLKITIACTMEQSKEFSKIFSLKYLWKPTTYTLNPNIKLELYDKINCKSCRETPFLAYSTKCCNKVYCENCSAACKNCFDCNRMNPEFEEESFINTFLLDMIYKCKCKMSVPLRNVRKHGFQCELSAFKCRAEEGCKFEGSQAELVAHVIYMHNEKVLREISQVVQMSFVEVQKECPKCMKFRFGHSSCSDCRYEPATFEDVLDKLQIT